jgi:hypothetical protein
MGTECFLFLVMAVDDFDRLDGCFQLWMQLRPGLPGKQQAADRGQTSEQTPVFCGQQAQEGELAGIWS